MRTIYCTANKLKVSFSQCATSVKKACYSVLTVRNFILVNYSVIIYNFHITKLKYPIMMNLECCTIFRVLISAQKL